MQSDREQHPNDDATDRMGPAAAGLPPPGTRPPRVAAYRPGAGTRRGPPTGTPTGPHTPAG